MKGSTSGTEKPHVAVAGWHRPARCYRRGLGSHSRKQIKHDQAVHPYSEYDSSQNFSVLPKMPREETSPYVQHWWGHIVHTLPRFGPPGHERCQETEEDLTEDCYGNQWVGACDGQGE